MLTLEILFVRGCPNRERALERLKAVLGPGSDGAQIKEIEVSDERHAFALDFPGSPTIRINGVEVEPEREPGSGLACRLYDGDGLPSEESLRQAISAARER